MLDRTRRPYVTADVKKQVIEGLAKRLGHVPTPDELIEEARNPRHPLYSSFGFDDVHGAALNYWRDIARSIIAECRIAIETSTRIIESPIYVEDPNKIPNTQGYITVAGQTKETDEAVVRREIDDAVRVYLRGLGIAKRLTMEKRYKSEFKRQTE
jgi:hypothetical protein